MILLCGIPSEPPLALARAALADAGAPVLMFNQRRFAACDVELEVFSLLGAPAPLCSACRPSATFGTTRATAAGES